MIIANALRFRLCAIEQEGHGHALPRFALRRFYGLRGTHVGTGSASYLGHSVVGQIDRLGVETSHNDTPLARRFLRAVVYRRPRRARTLRARSRASIGPDSYHYVVEGELRIRVDGEDGEGLVLGAGDVVLLPRNNLHLVGSDLTLPPVAGSDITQPPKDGGLFTIHHGGSGRRTRMICGFLGCSPKKIR